MGPRRFRRGNVVVSSFASTHNASFNGAATFPPRKSAGKNDGRAKYIAELQWGRDVSAAEILALLTLRTGSSGFNGAATFPPRK